MAESVYNSSYTGEQIDAAVAWLLAHAQDHINGGAVSGTTISVPANPTFWFAGAGTYTCGSSTITIPSGAFGIISYDGTNWSSTSFPVAADKADVITIGGARKLVMSQAPFASLVSVEQLADAGVDNNKMWWSSDNGHLKYKANNTVYDLGNPPYTLYYCGNKVYKWNGNGFTSVGGNGQVINNLNTGGTEVSLSAEQGKNLKGKINEVYMALQSVYNALGNAAFWGNKTPVATMLPDLDWSVTKHTLTIVNSIGSDKASITRNNADVGGSIQVEEEAQVQLKVAGKNGWAISNVQVSGASASVTESNGVFTITLTMGSSDMSITISGDAVKAATVTKTLTGCSVVQNSESSASPTIGGSYSVQIAPSEGNSFSSFSVTMEDDTNPSKITVTEANGVKTISISEVTGNILIVAVAAGLLVHGYKINHGEGNPQAVQDANYCYTRLIPVSNGDELLVDNGFILGTIASALIYDNTAVDGDVSTGFLGGYITANNRARTYLVNKEGAAFLRIVMKESELDKIASYNGTKQSYIYKGNNSPILDGMLVRRALDTNGAVSTPGNGNYCVTPYIAVPANVTKLQAFKGLSGWGSSFVGQFYNSSKSRISQFASGSDPFVADIPANTAFIRFTMVAVGHWADSYVFAYDEDNGDVINGTYLWRGPGLPYAPNDPNNPANQSE